MKERPADFRGLLSSSSSSLYSLYWRLVIGVLVAVNNIVDDDDDIFDGVRIMIFLFS